MKAKDYCGTAKQYALEVVGGKIVAGAEIVMACQRFLNDLERTDIELRARDPNAVCSIMEGFFVHQQGEDMHGTRRQSVQTWRRYARQAVTR